MTGKRTTSKAWYIKYPRDAYALGPFRFPKPVTATEARREAKRIFGENPREIWVA